MAKQLKPVAKYILIGAGVLAVFLCAKKFILDAPKNVDAAQTVQKFQLADMSSSPSLPANEKLALPNFGSEASGGTNITWQIMAWNSQFPLMYANGGRNTAKGSLFEKNGLNVSIIRQDDCNKTIADFIKNASDYKSNPSTTPMIMSFMGDGVPGFSVMLKELEKLGPDFQPIVFYPMGRSNGEDAFMGPKEWKANPKNALGKSVCGVERDGDMNIVFKWAADNNIAVNVNTKVYDPSALNVIPASDFIDASNKYVAGYTEKRVLVRDGKTVPDSSITVTVDAVTTWTPGDQIVADKKGGLVRLASTKEYTSQMPNASIVLKKWAYDHREAMEGIIMALGQAGDQVRSFTEAQEFAAKVSAQVYGDADKQADYWLKYWKGFEGKDVTGQKVLLGGSMAFNLRDAANMFGLGDDHVDRYKVTYETFGNILLKLYPKEMQGYTLYTKMVDKSFLNSVISNHPELLKGEAFKQEYASEITSEVSNKSVSIEFDNGSDVIKPSSYKAIDDIYQSAVIAEGLKLGVYGHTNAVGSDEVNKPLSERRANAVAEYLRRKGLKSSQIESKGYGSDSPISGTDPADPRNRRVEIVLGN